MEALKVITFCRPCNEKKEMIAKTNYLYCDQGHRLLALNALLSGGR
jgi:hypothetical protein